MPFTASPRSDLEIILPGRVVPGELGVDSADGLDAFLCILRRLYYVAVLGMIFGSVMKTPIFTASVPFARQIGGILKASIIVTALSGISIA